MTSFGKRTIVIGDIHGCVDEFAQLLKEVNYEIGVDRLVLLGDLIDRGPDPAGVVSLAREVKAECVMGNHEEKAIRWRMHEAKRAAKPEKYMNPMRTIHVDRLAQWAKIPDADWDWLASLPCFLHINDTWTAVHAGCMPDIPIEQQKANELMRMRYINTAKMKMVSPDENGDMPPNSVHWTTLWNGPRDIVYGHYTRKEIHVTNQVVDDGVTRQGNAWTVGIDTGCVHGDFLTAAIFFEKNLPGFETHWVNAKKVYAERKSWAEE